MLGNQQCIRSSACSQGAQFLAEKMDGHISNAVVGVGTELGKPPGGVPSAVLWG